MRKTLRVFFLIGLALAVGRPALAEMVGEKFTQTGPFREFVSEQKALGEQNARVEAELAEARKEFKSQAYSGSALADAVIGAIPGLGLVISLWKAAWVVIMGLSVFCMAFYFYYLVRWNPMKWRLMVSGGTFGRVWRKLLRRNGVAGALFLALTLVPALSQAATNVLQDIRMYYTGSEFEKGYVQCKYATEKISLAYPAVNGVPVIADPEPGFDLQYDILAHMQGLGFGASAEDLAALYGQAGNDAQRALAASLLARADKAVAGEGARSIVETMCAARGLDLGVIIERFKALLAAFAGSDNRLLSNGLVRTFLESSVGRVKNLEGLDSLVDLAVENDAFEIIRDATAGAMKSLPSRLPFADSVYAARIFFKLDKDMAWRHFQAIRFDFPQFFKSETLTRKLAGLFRDMSGVSAFGPLYENEALYASLQRLPNDLRVLVAGFFDSVDPALAGVAYDSIGMVPGDLVFANPQTLVLLARLTGVLKKETPAEFLNALKRAVVEFEAPYTKEVLFEAVQKVGQSPAQFTESVLTQDMNTDCRFNRNADLFMSLIKTLSPEQIRAFEGYFAKKWALHKEILDFLFAGHKDAFYRLLRSLFETHPKQVAMMTFPNDIMDLTLVAPAFDKEALKGFSTLDAPFFLADKALSGPSPDLGLARRALVPEFDDLFKTFLGSRDKELSEKDAIAALILLTLVQRPGATVFGEETAVLERMVGDFFTLNRHAELTGRLERNREELAALEGEIKGRESGRAMRFANGAYVVLLVCYILAAAIFSIRYACNLLIPGKNHSLLSFLIYGTEAGGVFAMATLIHFPLGLGMVLVAQLLRGLSYFDRTTLDMRDAVAALREEPAPMAEASEAGTRG